MTGHIAFFNIPALGHVHPSLPVVAELVRRGHRVSYATVAERAALVAATGAAVVPYRSLRPSDCDPGLRVPDRTEHLGRSLLNFLDEAAATLPQLEPAFAADPPDLVVFDRMSFAGRVFAEKHGLPAVQLWPMMLPGPQWSTARLPVAERAHPAFREYLERLAGFLADHGLPPDLDGFLGYDVAHHIAFFPRGFQVDGERFDGSHSFVGPCVGPRPGQPQWTRPDDGRPVVLITLGSLNNLHPDFYRMCIDAFAGSRWRVVMPVGQRFDPAVLGRPPANVEIAPVVPQLSVLTQADAFVSHAGMGGVMEALWAGVPQVAIARTPEQELNAARVAHLRLGVRLAAGGTTGERLHAAVEAVAGDPDVTLGVAAMRHEALAAGGPGRAADVIEANLAGSGGRAGGCADRSAGISAE